MKLIAFIAAIVLIGGGVYYYEHQSVLNQNPLTQYQNIIKLPTADQASAFVAAAKAWVKDPVNNTSYPKGWQHGPMTIKGQTFTIVTPDTTVPPNYYVSFNFPKSLIASQHLIKCLGTSSTSTTNTCLVGDNPEIDAYFTIVSWVQRNANPATQSGS